MNPKLRDAILQAVFRKTNPDNALVFLFGSYATGEAVESSDIDVGMLSDPPLSAKDFLAIQEEIQNTFPTLRKVDFVDFGDLSEKSKIVHIYSDENVEEIYLLIKNSFAHTIFSLLENLKCRLQK